MPQAMERRALIVGASRGLGLGLVEELAARGWDVVGTLRGNSKAQGLSKFAEASGGRVTTEIVDINEPEQLAGLRQRLDGQRFDLLFVNAGVANDRNETIGDVSTDEFIRVLVTNTLSPMRAIERLHDLVAPNGVIGVMSSGLASVANNTEGGLEIYRASKAGLNTLLRSFAARNSEALYALVAIAPGWVATDMGGENAPLTVEQSMRGVADVLEGRLGQRGAAFLSYEGKTMPW